ncbi:hypothetical protein GGF31_003446 [Allomyces arbusculus]|nr:hypothetical protein GGF31_003446 [Allomyces arbusculus]
MSVKTIHSLALQLCSAMAYCHGKFIMHRDLKPCNIMMTNDLTLKIGDFGISRYMSYPFGPNTKEIVTLYYRPPEILLGETVYDFTVDSWSVGCILGELFKLNVIFKGQDQIDQLNKICSILGAPTSTYFQSLPNYSFLPAALFQVQPCLGDHISRDHFLFPIVEGLLTYSIDNRWNMVKATEYLARIQALF